MTLCSLSARRCQSEHSFLCLRPFQNMLTISLEVDRVFASLSESDSVASCDGSLVCGASKHLLTHLVPVPQSVYLFTAVYLNFEGRCLPTIFQSENMLLLRRRKRCKFVVFGNFVALNGTYLELGTDYSLFWKH